MNEPEAVDARRPADRVELALFGLVAATVLFFLFFRLGSVPAGSFSDEVSAGFNARCIDRTLRDQYGTLLPLFFRALEDYKSPLFIYAVALTEGVLGPSPIAVRLPSALYAIGTAVLLFFLLRSLTRSSVLARWMALLSLLVPSLFFYARSGFSEASSLPFWLVLALWMLRRFERIPSHRRAAIAGACIGLVTYSYTTARLLAPLLLAAACLSFWLAPRFRRFVAAMLAGGAALGAPMAVFMLVHPGAVDKRFREAVSVWRDHPTTRVAVERIVGTYFQHLASLDFLFRTGQHLDWVNAGEGLLPLWLFAPVVLGIASLWRRRKDAYFRVLSALWLISPIPVALTWENLPHTTRYLHFAIVALVVGALALSDAIAAVRPSRGTLALMLVAALGEGALSLRTYFVDYATRFANEGGYDDDMGNALQLAFARRKTGEPVYLPGSFFDISGVRIAFYADLDPVAYRTKKLDDVGIHASGWHRPEKGAIVVEPGRSAPSGGARLLGTASRPNGTVVWSVYRVPS